MWTRLHRTVYHLARAAVGHDSCPTVVIMDGQSVKTTERGGSRGFDAHKVIKGRKRHILVDTLGLLIATRVEPAGLSDRRAGERLVSGLAPLWPRIRTSMADAGHESRRLARLLHSYAGWRLEITKRRERPFKITGLTWIVERSFAWLGWNRRLSKDYEYHVQTSKTLIKDHVPRSGVGGVDRRGARLGRFGQAARVGRLTVGSSLRVAMVSGVM